MMKATALEEGHVAKAGATIAEAMHTLPQLQYRAAAARCSSSCRLPELAVGDVQQFEAGQVLHSIRDAVQHAIQLQSVQLLQLLHENRGLEETHQS